MKVLLDECVPRRLGNAIDSQHQVSTVTDSGWSGIKNGELLRLAEPAFDAFVTVDQKLRFQQNLELIDLVVIVLIAKSNDIDDLLPLMPQVSYALKNPSIDRLILIGDMVGLTAKLADRNSGWDSVHLLQPYRGMRTYR